MTIKPYGIKPIPGGGTQHIYRFANGFGASVTRDSPMTYGDDEAPWELMVIQWTRGGGPTDWDFAKNGAGRDREPEGWLTDEALQARLEEIQKFL